MSRIIAGSAKGRRLTAPKGTQTRPTTDRVKEALFSALASWFGTADETSGVSCSLSGANDFVSSIHSVISYQDFNLINSIAAPETNVMAHSAIAPPNPPNMGR